MPVMSQGWPAESRLSIWNTACGDFHSRNISPQPQYSATNLKMWKSARAAPGAAATFRTTPMRRSEFIKVPSFSPQPAAGSTKCASRAVSVAIAERCCVNRKTAASHDAKLRQFLRGTKGANGVRGQEDRAMCEADDVLRAAGIVGEVAG